MKVLLPLLVVFTHVAPLSGAELPRQSASNPPDMERFAPVGWVSTQSAEGDLNGDGRADLAAVLLRSDLADGNPVEEAGSRGLLVLFADPAGGYRYQDFVPDALPCAACLGNLGRDPEGPVFDLAIVDQRLTVGWSQDTGEKKEVKLIVGYDRERGVLRLLGDETVTTDLSLGKASRLIRDYKTGTMTSDGRESSFPPRFVPLIEVSAEDY